MSRKSIYVCDNCGADIVFNLNESIRQCSYCGCVSAIVDDNIFKYNFTNIIPFDISYEKALKQLEKSNKKYADLIYNNCIVEKVFLPFCDIECDVVSFASCEKRIDDSNYYYDVFIDGHINNCLSLSINNINPNDVIFSEYIIKEKSVKYNPLISNNCNIVTGTFKRLDKMVDLVAKNFSRDIIGNCKITNLSSSEYNVNIKNTLVPFYKVTAKGPIDFFQIYILGQDFSGIVKNLNKKNNTMLIMGTFLLILLICALVFIHSFSIYKNGDGIEHLHLIIFSIIGSFSVYILFIAKANSKYGIYKMKKNRKTKLLGKYIDIFK